MFAISYQRGVLIYEQFEKMDGDYFADFMHRIFISMFQHSINPIFFLFLQDRDPRQNSKIAKIEVSKI